MSRWDRPKEPRDLRWVLGVVGKVLVWTGILLFAFVAYQLWGTGIQTAREQNRLRGEFEAQLETTVPLTTVPVTTVPPPSSTASPVTTVEASTTTEATTTTTTAPPPVVTAPPLGDPVAQLDIPAMDLHGKIVVEGVAPSNLQDGPGHFPETPLPGQLGNAALAGHRTTHGQPFRHIDRLEPGDDITVTTLAGTYVYVVTGQQIVGPNDYDLVIPTVDPTKATLTLTSCHPVHSSAKRIVVVAELDTARSSPLTLAATGSTQTPSALPGEDDTGSETTTASTEPSTSVTATTPAPSTSADAAPSTPDTATPAGDVDTPADSRETFRNDWFSDPDAIPQVLLWGFLLAAVWVGIHLVSRRFRSYWIGIPIGIVPFVVVLYFFFENVNRLLPPNL
ncbi:MAG: class E sortase [Ilumatobacteraceae bacterium]